MGFRATELLISGSPQHNRTRRCRVPFHVQMILPESILRSRGRRVLQTARDLADFMSAMKGRKSAIVFIEIHRVDIVKRRPKSSVLTFDLRTLREMWTRHVDVSRRRSYQILNANLIFVQSVRYF